jgi:hypothetical protein
MFSGLMFGLVAIDSITALLNKGALARGGRLKRLPP